MFKASNEVTIKRNGQGYLELSDPAFTTLKTALIPAYERALEEYFHGKAEED